MKIAIIGYGRMGKMVEQAAHARGHEVVAKFDVDNNVNGEGLTTAVSSPSNKSLRPVNTNPPTTSAATTAKNAMIRNSVFILNSSTGRTD